MTRNDRHLASGGVLAALAVGTLAVVGAWGQPGDPAASPKLAQAARRPAQTRPAPTLGRPRVKPSEPPHLMLFFTDQVVGYIQPCG
ncbi:MAG: hypothetical protein V3U98_12095 [Acidobacteriota bacterium]